MVGAHDGGFQEARGENSGGKREEEEERSRKD